MTEELDFYLILLLLGQWLVATMLGNTVLDGCAMGSSIKVLMESRRLQRPVYGLVHAFDRNIYIYLSPFWA